jgi:hypothetical protein
MGSGAPSGVFGTNCGAGGVEGGWWLLLVKESNFYYEVWNKYLLANLNHHMDTNFLFDAHFSYLGLSNEELLQLWIQKTPKKHLDPIFCWSFIGRFLIHQWCTYHSWQLELGSNSLMDADLRRNISILISFLYLFPKIVIRSSWGNLKVRWVV